MKVVIWQMNPIVGDLEGNTRKIIHGIEEAKKSGADLILFPELAMSGYPPEDLLLLPQFIEAVNLKLDEIIASTKGIGAIIGLPRKNPTLKEKCLHNSAAIIFDTQLLGYHDKVLLPTYDVFDERRYFEPGGKIQLWKIKDTEVGVSICEDIWGHSECIGPTSYLRDPIQELGALKPALVINISSSPYSLDKPFIRYKVASKAALSIGTALILCNQVGGNDSLLFDGYSLYVNKRGELLQCAKGFSEDTLFIDTKKSVETIPFPNSKLSDLTQALVMGIRDYMFKQGFKKACLGISGGIDSAVVACLASEALGKENVLGVIMPSRFTSKTSIDDAKALADNLGIRTDTISIEKPFEAFLDLLEPHFEGKPFDVTEENIQARIRGVILMALSNKHGYIVLNTGNKSEYAMGYATLYGDMCGGLSVISDLTKGQVYLLAELINKEKELIPESSIKKAPTAELRANQKDSDTLPDYAILDTVLKEYVENHLSPEEIAHKHKFSIELVEKLVKSIHLNEYKRRQAPPTLRVTEKAFIRGRNFPIVQKWV